MTKRSLLLSSAAMLLHSSPLFAQPQPAPATAAPPASEQPLAAAPTTPPRAASAAPAAAPAEDYGDEEEIVITGAKPRGSVVGDIPPENTLDARDVRATGATSITELLDAIAPQVGSARGRGGESPVLLLNGQRISGFRELRDIPTEAIERVEIMPEEVALKYGYRADQKVVNIVLRQRFRSTTVQAGAGLATDGGYANGNADLTRFLVQRNGRTTYNLHAEGNTMLTENERNIVLDPLPTVGTLDQNLTARSLTPSRRDLRASTTVNRTILTDVSATVNGELEHTDGHSLIGLNSSLLEPLDRKTDDDTAHLGFALNGQTKSQWKWTVTGNGDLGRSITRTDRDSMIFPRDRVRETTASADITATANGNLFKVPAGNANTTLTLGGDTGTLDSSRTRAGARSSNSLSRTEGKAAINLDLPISRRGKDFSALGNLTLNGNPEVNQFSDFGTLTTIGAGANWSPFERISLIASWTREEGPPTVNQLGDPVLDTPNSRIFDFTTGQTVLVDAITGGNPDLKSDRRNVMKLSANWQPWQNGDFRLRADYVHQKIRNPISNITVTPAIEAAFPDRFIRDSAGDLVVVDLRPINFDSASTDTLRFGFDFSKALKSRRPSQSVIDQMRAQFFGQRGSRGQAAAPVSAQNAAPSAGASPPDGVGRPSDAVPPTGGGGSRGGGFGGRGFFGGAGSGQNRGRIQFSLTDTVTFEDKVRITPGGPELDYLHGDAKGSGGGTPRHNVQAQAGYFNNGLGARIGTNWKSGTTVNTLTGDDLRFSPVGTFDLKLFANPGDIPEIALKHPWLRGTQVRFELNNVFNSRPRVRDATGAVPLSYQPDLLDPLGRTIMISFRKLFLPSPSAIRQMFQRERQGQQPTTR